MTMTTKELLALVGKATEGKFSAFDWGDNFKIEAVLRTPGLPIVKEVALCSGDRRRANAELIVAAVTALPALCAEVEAVREMMRGMIAEADRDTDPFIRARAYLATVAKEPK